MVHRSEVCRGGGMGGVICGGGERVEASSWGAPARGLGVVCKCGEAAAVCHLRFRGIGLCSSCMGGSWLWGNERR